MSKNTKIKQILKKCNLKEERTKLNVSNPHSNDIVISESKNSFSLTKNEIIKRKPLNKIITTEIILFY